ncbi:hypothetical protein M9H77_08841 [Catharanthus roseus]|uniref:Uncharacterized protein n=1 Tax=Catharanthus roseus TaxID=4058 RepID=A0ACC0BZB6_CATRO|nr:hypothetical protein M9H77_08841 [Catharanthus roseus]
MPQEVYDLIKQIALNSYTLGGPRLRVKLAGVYSIENKSKPSETPKNSKRKTKNISNKSKKDLMMWVPIQQKGKRRDKTSPDSYDLGGQKHQKMRQKQTKSRELIPKTEVSESGKLLSGSRKNYPDHYLGLIGIPEGYSSVIIPRKTTVSLKRARITNPSSLETNPLIFPFPDSITDNRIKLKQTLDPTLDNELEIFNLFASLGWGRMNPKSGVYYSLLVKDVYTNITQKNNKDLINIKTTVKGVHITLDRTLLANISSIPNTGPAIIFGSISRIILGDEAWKYSAVCLRVGIHPWPNTRYSSTTRNANDLSPRMRATSDLIGTNLIPRSRKSLNELRIMDIYLLDKLLSSSPINFPCITVHSIREMVSTKRKQHFFSYPLLLTDIFCHFGIDFQIGTKSAGGLRSYRTKPARHPGKAVADEKKYEDDDEGTEGSGEESDATLKQMQIKQT